ncbi:hypothetical protein PHJA_002344000, partial [Phtheirospermum japonicum]
KPKTKNKKQKHQHTNDQTAKIASDLSFKPSSDVKGLRFGSQFIVKSFTIRCAQPPELLRLLSLPPSRPALASAAAFLPTNFTILAHHAWHTLTLGLGTKKSKVVLFVFVFESEGTWAAAERLWPAEIPLGEVNKRENPPCASEMVEIERRLNVTAPLVPLRRRVAGRFAITVAAPTFLVANLGEERKMKK